MPDHAVTAPLAFCNHALALLGEDEITDLLPESGATNAACATIYDRIVDSLLSKFDWGFARRDLELSALTDAPPDPWTTQYNLPANTLRIISTDQPGEPYTIAANHDPNDTDGTRRLYAMRTGVRARVIVRPLDELFPAHFADAVIYRLAADLAPAVTGQGRRDLEEKAMGYLSEAKLHDLSEYPTRRMPDLPDPRAFDAGGDWFGGRVFS